MLKAVVLLVMMLLLLLLLQSQRRAEDAAQGWLGYPAIIVVVASGMFDMCRGRLADGDPIAIGIVLSGSNDGVCFIQLNCWFDA